MSVEVRKEQAGDVDDIFEINCAAFGRDVEAKLVSELRAAGNLMLSMVAARDGRLAGHIAFSPITVGSNSCAALAPMAVRPELQKQGIGSRLIDTALDELRLVGAEAVFVLGHPGYYPRFGFKPSVSSFNIKSTYDVPDEVFMALELEEGALAGIEGTAIYSKEFEGLS